MNAMFATIVAAVLALSVTATGCIPEATGVAAVIAAQRRKVRVIKIGIKVYKVTKYTDKEFKELVEKVKAAHEKPADPVFPPPLDAYRFQGLINTYRQEQGLGPLAWDNQLAIDAEENNRRGGHHVYMGSAGGQCWASVTDMSQAFEMWKHSPGHDRLMRGRSFTKFGIASGPGNHCTLNLK